MNDRSVTEVVVNLYKMATAENIVESETGEHITFEDYQYMLSKEVLDLADVIGIDLDEKGEIMEGNL